MPGWARRAFSPATRKAKSYGGAGPASRRTAGGWGGAPRPPGDLGILNFGPGDPSFLIAMNAESGKTEWKVELAPRLPAEDVAKAGELAKRADGAVRSDFFGSWTTPVIGRANKRE